MRQRQPDGLYRAIVSLYVPNGTAARGIRRRRQSGPIALTTEAGRTLVQFGARPSGRAIGDDHLRVAAPAAAAGPYRMQVIPRSRVRPTPVSADIDLGDGRIRKEPTPLVGEPLAEYSGR